ncbi:MAG: DUF4339 domain-containing protein [Planctomycetes bacterium]|nr:DUF4339 domain-containing protein [Planctomycetota bacterium]
MASAWFIVNNGKEHGPFSSGRMRELAHDGKINTETIIRKDGSEKTLQAGSVQGLLPGTGRVQRKSKSGRRQQKHERQKQGQQGSAHGGEDGVGEDIPSLDYGEGQKQTANTFDAFAQNEDYVEHIRAQQMDQGFYLNLVKSLLFPFSMNTVAFMVAYVVLGVLLSTLGVFFIKLWWGFEALFLFFTLWFVMYGFAYAVRILLRSAEGDRKSPSWPELGAFMEQILGPAVLLLATLILVNILFIFHAWGDLSIVPDSAYITPKFQDIDVFLFHGLDLLFRLPIDGVSVVMQILTALLTPMIIVQVITKGGFLGLHPLPMFERLTKSFPAYVVLLVFVVILHLLMMSAWMFTGEYFSIDSTLCYGYLVGEFLPQMDFIDQLLFWTMCIVPTVSCIFLQYHVMGVFFHSESEKW